MIRMLLVVCLVAMVACGAAPAPTIAPAIGVTLLPTNTPIATQTPPPTAAPSPTATPAPTPTPARPELLLSAMTLDQKIGQTMCVGFIGPAFAEELRQLLRDLHLGCLFLFTSNVESPAQVAQLVRDAQEAARANGDPPLIIAVDQEGGVISRLTQDKGFIEFLSPMALAATSDAVGNARIVGQTMARELKALGVNMNLAPVLDVNTNPLNPIIGVRSFGSQADRVAAVGAAFIDAIQAEGVMAVGKHFPGHGSVAEDSHLTLPTTLRTRAELEAVDLVPFRAAISDGVAAVMTSHIVFPALDATPNLPATLSPAMLTGLLRDKLKFDGLLMSDSLEMGALDNNGFPLPIAAATSLAAGADLLSMNHIFDEYRAAFSEIKVRVERGEIPMGRLDDAVRRVLRAKERFGVFDAPWPDPTIAAQAMTDVEARAQVDAVLAASITLARDDSKLVPLSSGAPLFVVETPYAYGLSYSLGAPGMRVSAQPTEGEIASAVAQAPGRTVLVATSDMLLNPAQHELVRQLVATGTPVIVWAVKSPYDVAALKDVAPLTILTTYGTSPYLLIEPIRAVLYGQATATGKLPVEMP